MDDQKTVGSGPPRQCGATTGPEQCNPPTRHELGVCGRTLLESESGSGETLIALHGALDRSAAERIDEQQLCVAMQSTPEVCLDVTGLTETGPEALKVFLERQRSGQRAAQRLTIRINPAQVAGLLQ